MEEQGKSRIEELALKRSMIGAFVLAVWGIGMAAISGSGAVMLDGMYNLVSSIMTFFSIEITRLVYGKETKDFPLGYFAFESLFVFIKGASILILVLMALYSNIAVLLSGGRDPALGLMTAYVVIAVIGCFLLYRVTRKGFKETGSDILNAESQAWLLNGVITGAIGVAFVITIFIQSTAIGWIARYVDQVLVVLLSIVFIKDPIVLMKSGIKELLLAAPQEDYTAAFEEKILPLSGELGAKNLRVELIKTGRRIWVTVRVDPEKEILRVTEIMALKERLKAAAREVYDNTDTEVILERA